MSRRPGLSGWPLSLVVIAMGVSLLMQGIDSGNRTLQVMAFLQIVAGLARLGFLR